MFLRFQAFNKQIDYIDNMYPVKQAINEGSKKIEETKEKLVQKDKEISGNVFSLDELDFIL